MRALSLSLLLGCSQTVSATAGDASTDAAPRDAVAADVSAGPCTWRVGEAREVQHARPLFGCELVDVALAGRSVWVASLCDRGTSAAPNPRVAQVSVDGTSEWETELDADPASDHPISIAVDDTLGRRGALVAARAPYLVTFGPDNAVRARTTVESVPTSFPLGDHRHLMINRAGFTCVADQIRALWGVSMLQFDASGRAVSAVDLGLTDFPPTPYERFALPDRGFVMTWTDHGRDAGPATLRLRRHDEDGAARTTAAHVLDARAIASPHVAVVPTPAGMLALWEGESAAVASQRVVVTRALGADGSPARAAVQHDEIGFYGGGLHATTARGDVLATAVTGSGVLRLVVHVLGADGAPRGQPLAVSTVQPIAPGAVRARLVAMGDGAAVVFQRDPRTEMIAPITCSP